MKLCVYLSGWTQETEYRKTVKENYSDKLRLIDPMTITPIGVCEKVGENCDYVYIIQRDKKLILKSDILVAYINRLSFGTIMEVMYSYDHGIPVYVINPSGEFLDDPWLLFHSIKQFRRIEDCFDFITSKK